MRHKIKRWIRKIIVIVIFTIYVLPYSIIWIAAFLHFGWEMVAAVVMFWTIPLSLMYYEYL